MGIHTDETGYREFMKVLSHTIRVNTNFVSSPLTVMKNVYDTCPLESFCLSI